MEVEHELREELDLTQNTIRQVLAPPTSVKPRNDAVTCAYPLILRCTNTLINICILQQY